MDVVHDGLAVPGFELPLQAADAETGVGDDAFQTGLAVQMKLDVAAGPFQCQLPRLGLFQLAQAKGTFQQNGATAATTQATNLTELLLLRGMTGLALGMAILIDAIEPQGRGRAIGRVMMGFSLAAVGGIPLSLELARLGNWTTPFWLVALLGGAVWLAAWQILPRRDAVAQADLVSPFSLLRQGPIRKACLIQGANQFAAFLIVPHFSAFFLLNLGFPREYLGLLYLAGGIASLIVMQVLGHLTDKAGPLPAVLMASLATAIGLTPFLGLEWSLLLLPFVCFMAGNAGRNVSIAALNSQVAAPGERAGYLALEGIVQDVMITLAALFASLILVTGTAGELLNTGWLGLLAFTCLGVLRWKEEIARGH